MITKEEYTCLAEKYIDMVWRLALGYVKNTSDADDITQNVFYALVRQSKTFESEAHARNWLLRVTVNECKKWFRSPWHKSVSFEEYAANLVFERSESRELLLAVMALPKKYRLPIYLHYYEGCTTDEIAAILKMPKGTVCTNLSRGRQALKEQLREDECYG